MKALLPPSRWGGFDGSGRRAAAVIAAISAVGLCATACAAGQIAETAEETPVVDAAEVTVGHIGLRGIGLQPPAGYWRAGSDAVLQMVIVNDGDQSDQLVSVSSPVASNITLTGNSSSYLTGTPVGPVSVSNPLTGSLASSASASVSPETTVPSVPGFSPAIPNTSPGSSPSVTGGAISPYTPSNPSGLNPSGSNSKLPTPGAALSSTPSAGLPLSISPHSSVSIGFQPDNPALVMSLNADLYPAQPFQVTFNFANAGSVTVQSVVRLDSSPPSPSVVPSLTATEG